MTAFCTYCSKAKTDDPGEVAAIRRYKSSRIQRVHEAADSLRLPFYILSGRFGLVSPRRPIPNYDHLLKSDEVARLAELVASQTGPFGISGFVYFTKPLSSDANLVVYYAVLSAACGMSSRPFFAVEFEEPAGQVTGEK
jgi:hypothetical protein